MYFKLLTFFYTSLLFLSSAYYIIGAKVNMREQPNTGSKVIRVLERSAEVELITNYNETWSEIKYNGQKGYVTSIYLSTTKPSVQQKQNIESQVLICNSSNSYAYHKYQCRGLSRCKAGISKINLSSAKSKGYSACKNCY